MDNMIHKITEWHRDFGSMPFLTTTQPLKEVCIMADSIVTQSAKDGKKRTRRKNVPATCEIEGCNRKYLAKGMCARHYWRLYSGKDILRRTRFEPNEIIIKGDIVEIVLYDPCGEEKRKAIIDVIDVPKVIGRKWCLTHGSHSGLYVICSSENLLLHRLILDIPDSMEGDHKDGNGLNNRRDNLRPATHSDNMHNSCSKRGTSKFKGVHFYKQTNKWRAGIASKHLGYFHNETDAALAYDAAARKYFGEFARPNFSEVGV